MQTLPCSSGQWASMLLGSTHQKGVLEGRHAQLSGWSTAVHQLGLTCLACPLVCEVLLAAQAAQGQPRGRCLHWIEPHKRLRETLPCLDQPCPHNARILRGRAFRHGSFVPRCRCLPSCSSGMLKRFYVRGRGEAWARTWAGLAASTRAGRNLRAWSSRTGLQVAGT